MEGEAWEVERHGSSSDGYGDRGMRNLCAECKNSEAFSDPNIEREYALKGFSNRHGEKWDRMTLVCHKRKELNPIGGYKCFEIGRN